MSQTSNRSGKPPLINIQVESNEREAIIKAAKEAIAKAPPLVPISMLGYPRTSEHDYPTDKTQSAPTESHCTRCKSPVWSTLLKDEIIRQVPSRAEVLCFACMVKLHNQ